MSRMQFPLNLSYCLHNISRRLARIWCASAQVKERGLSGRVKGVLSIHYAGCFSTHPETDSMVVHK